MFITDTNFVIIAEDLFSRMMKLEKLHQDLFSRIASIQSLQLI